MEMQTILKSIDNELVDMSTGEILGEDCPFNEQEQTDIDALIVEYEQIIKQAHEYHAKKCALENTFVMMAQSLPGETKTRRVAGKMRVVKVQFRQNEKWDQDELEIIKESIGAEEFFKYFRVGEYKPNVKEMQKLQNTAGDPEALYFRFAKTKRTAPAKPYITIDH